ncbi:MAG: glycosyltransferase [Bryobacteraceae bacterium]
MRGTAALPPVLIPAYKPPPVLLRLAEELAARGFGQILIVNDGSGAEYDALFRQLQLLPQVTVLRHETNRGKGEALKTGLRHALESGAAGIVTADADGQHLAEDIERVARRLAAADGTTLVLGRRSFEGSVPLRSRAGNVATAAAMRWIAGVRLADTQTGLRGIPRALAERLLRARTSGYEFELDMLLMAKHAGFAVDEVPIRTVYLEGNRSSHFNPLRDSMRIYFVLLRFTFVSLATALIDNAVFQLALGGGLALPGAHLAARAAALSFQYPAARRAVFHSREPHRRLLPKFLTVAAGHALLSWAAIHWLTGQQGLELLPAKIAVETSLFPLNFLLQRDWVFTSRRPLQAP